MLVGARAHLYSLIVNAWGDTAIVLPPEDRNTFEAALKTAAATDSPVVRYYPPQLLRLAGVSEYLCTLDVCHPTPTRAAEEADRFLRELGNSRYPTGVITPRAVPIRETSYHRVNVTFTTLHATSNDPPPPSD